MKDYINFEREEPQEFGFEISGPARLRIEIYDGTADVSELLSKEEAQKLRDFLNYHYPKE